MSPRKALRATYRNVVEARQVKAKKPKVKREDGSSKPSFLRFMAASFSCSLLDQLLAWLLFSALRRPLGDMGFVRILISNVTARCVSLTLNYALNHRLVFSIDVDDPEWIRNSRRESLPRFLLLSAIVLALSTLGVFLASTYLGILEWKAKIVVDVCLFFLNYNVQRNWVFRNEVSISPKHAKRPQHLS